MGNYIGYIANWVAGVARSYGAGSYVSSAIYWGVYIGGNVAVSYGVNSLLRGEAKSAGGNRVPYNQTMPPRKRVINRARIVTADSRMLYESKRSFYQINAICQSHGSVLRFDQYWLHGDKVTVRADNDKVQATDGNPNKYNGNGIWWLTRRGLPTETSYSTEGPWHSGEGLDDLGPGVWTAQHRGDGVASLLLVCAPVEQANYRNVYPNGHPMPSILPVLGVYDWRKDSTRGGAGSHRLDDVDTWEESWNPVLWLAQVEAGPIERADFLDRFERKIAGALDSWTLAADHCDQTVLGAARYEIAGWYYDNEPLADIRRRILETCDGYLVEVSGGALHIQVGVWRAPTLTIPRDHIKALRWRRGKKTENAVNELVVSHLSPEQDWYAVPAKPWRDEADISLRGLKSRDFACPWVPREGQARRLAKIAMGQAMADGEGTVRTTLYGLNICFAAPPEGEVANRRWVTLERDRADGSVELLTVEIVGSPRIDLKTLSVEFSIRRATPEIYDWSAEEEGGSPDTPPDPLTGIGWLNFQFPENSILNAAVI